MVLGLLAWLYLGARLTLYAAEVNVVLRHRLWPRTPSQRPLLDADKRALTFSAEVEERVHREDVQVTFEPPKQTPCNSRPDGEVTPESASWSRFSGIRERHDQSTCARNNTALY